jgi:hypothetical protein
VLKAENFDFHSADAELMLEHFIDIGDLRVTKLMFESAASVNPIFSHSNDSPLLLL